MPVAGWRERCRYRADILDVTSTVNGSPQLTVFVGGVWGIDREEVFGPVRSLSVADAQAGWQHKEFGYPSTAEANEATAPQIAAHSPSDNSKTTISDPLRFSGRAAARADRSDRDGPPVMRRLRSAASARWRRFRDTGLAG